MIRFRPHHFLCALGFEGKGYSDDFTANMSRIVMDGLRGPGGDETEIEVVWRTDDICAPCPKRRGRDCADQDKIQRLDNRHRRALQLKRDEVLSWGNAKARIVAHAPPGALADLCAGCQWLELGLCEAALTRLHEAAAAEKTKPAE